MKARSLFGSLLFVFASVLNPAYFAGCGTEDFQFDAADLTALLETANGSFETTVSGHDYRVELEVWAAAKPEAEARAWWSTKAFACGNRTLYASASACDDSTSMDVEGNLTVTQLDGDEEGVIVDDATIAGRLEVSGLKLTNGHLEISLNRGTVVSLSSRDGKEFDIKTLWFYPPR